ncbi:hypothetical protein Tco_0794945 [Tanacetum coccineum]
MPGELGYGIRDTWDDLVGAIQEIAPTTLVGEEERVLRAAWARRPEETDSDFRAAENRLSEAEAVSRNPEDSEEPQGSDDRDTETAGTC